MSLLNRLQILQADDLKHEDVAVPEWGGSVRVSALTAADRNAWEISLRGNGGIDAQNASAKLAMRCMVDESGSRIFRDEDAASLGQKSAAALARVVNVAMRLNGIGAGEVEAAVKN